MADEEKTHEEFEHDLLKLLHRTRNGWRRDKSLNDLKAIRVTSHKAYQQYSKQIKVIKKVLTPLLRAHAWHYFRFSGADKLIAEQEKLRVVKVKKGGRKKRPSEMSVDELLSILTPEMLAELADRMK